MARLRRRETAEPPYDEIGWDQYGYLPTRRATFPWEGLPWEPVQIGPTWQTTDDGLWLLPERTIGWWVLGWSERWLNFGTDKAHRRIPWRYTDEQARFLLWWYAIDRDGRFLFRDGVLQRLKGWGKDPMGACLCFAEAFGPVRFDGFQKKKRAMATDVPDAWVQTAAVALEQTKNTTRFFPVLLGGTNPPSEIRVRYGLQVGKTLVHGLGDSRLIEAVTSSPATLEGARATFLFKNETQHWTASNEGHEMADAIERNATKSPDGGARTLAGTNAYEPSEDSVGQRDREAHEKIEAGTAEDVGLLYDSLEAPPEAPLSAVAAPDVVNTIRGDSTWLDIPRIVQSILDVRNPASRSRRFWYNQITAAEDAWVSTQEWDGAANPAFIVAPKDIVTLGFDGSRSDDHTALIGCHVDGDHLFQINVWVPKKPTKKSIGEIDRRAVDRAVRAAFEMYDVVGFYADVQEWESYIDDWAEAFGDSLVVKATPHQPVAWDMRNRQKQFTLAVERLHGAIVDSTAMAVDASTTGGDPGERLTHDGAKRFRQHALNARRAPNDWGVSVRKEHRESARKIDAVPAATLARLGRMDYLALPPSRRRKKRTGVVW